MKEAFPASEAALRTVVESRATIQRILRHEDPRLLVIVGPCSIHDPKAAMDYAHRLLAVREAVKDTIEIVMRVYFEKPRTTVGWKGLINDPNLDGSTDIEKGLRIGRELMRDILELGMPIATEFLDTIVPQYISDLVCWAAIGARTTESQTHREMASGLSMPVGFKNSTDGSVQIAVDAMGAAKHPHAFLGIDQEGCTCIVRTSGNPYGHVVLRGGNARTNYDAASIAEATERIEKAGLPPVVMVDCSHANSGKDPIKQEIVWDSILAQRQSGSKAIIGLMVESFIEAGNQKIPDDKSQLRYGVSVTDSCLDWVSTERLLRTGAALLKA
jgi:3-deoxy-7-phosphoheptulonate synthase